LSAWGILLFDFKEIPKDPQPSFPGFFRMELAAEKIARFYGSICDIGILAGGLDASDIIGLHIIRMHEIDIRLFGYV
jgi:hypothetical protein